MAREPQLQTTEISPESVATDGPRVVRLVFTVVTDTGSFAHVLPQDGTVTSIGRALECELFIDDPKLSRKHASVSVAGGHVVLRDLGSSNGTRVRNTKLAPDVPTRLSVGDVVLLGSTMLVLHEGRSSEVLSKSSAPTADRVPLATMQPVLERVAASSINVLILGETGTGKEVVARALHQLSPRAAHPMVCVNCAALSAHLLESELFGHERGAFTGATQAKVGLLESAGQGTVFLDEVGEIPLEVQAKLLRVLEQREVLRVGAVKPQPLFARFVAATNRDLEAESDRGAFRSDLFFRLNGFTLSIPPLRERKADIEPLARAFVKSAHAQAGRSDALPRIPAETMALLREYSWPGNVRELRNAIERALVLCDDAVLAEHLPEKVRRRGASVRPSEAEATEPDGDRARILAALEQCAGNQTQAAKLLGMSRRTLVTRLGEYDIKRPRKR